jgi:signal transduction histidine kinase/ActR/RegA family two-component response regulator
MLVEDDRVDQLAFTRMMEEQNLPYDYVVAESIREAFEFLEDGHIDVIILDYKLDDGTAFDLIENSDLEIPVIIVTGTGDEEVAVSAMRAGAVDYLIKDIDRNYLTVLPLTVEKALTRQGIETQSRMLTQAMISINDCVFVTDMQERIIYVNTAFCETYGYKDFEIQGKVSSTLGEMGWKGEFYHLRKDQRQFPVSLTRSIVKDDRAREIAVVGVARDISDLKQAETELIAQKQLFENLVAIARATSERLNLEATLQNTLDVAAELTGAKLGSLFLFNEDLEVVHSILARGRAAPHQKDELVGRVMNQGLAGWVVEARQPALIQDTAEDDRWLISEASEYQPRSALSVPILSRELVTGVLTLTHPDTHRFTVDHLNLIQAAADQMALALRNAQMFDEQRRQAELQVTLYRVLRTVGSLLDPDEVADAAAEEIVRLTSWPSVALLFPSEQGGQLKVQASAGALFMQAGEELPDDQGAVGAAFQSGKPHRVPDSESDADYIPHHPEIRSEIAFPLRRGDAILGVLSLSSKQAEKFTSNDAQLAESLADAISLAMENARLFQETQMTAERLRELDRLKSAFLANMSHELRTPLNAILGYSELLQDDAKEMDLDDFVIDLDNIQRAGKHLLAVINDILDFSKIEAGRMDLFLEAFDVASLVEDVLTTLQPLIEKNNNQLVVDLPEGLGTMKADPTKVRQIVINLLSNATKFTEDGEITLSVRRKSQDGIEEMSFHVQDTGIGMSAKQLETLFQPFIQGDISTTRKYGGTGLGLAITRGFCQMMGGEVFVESHVGQGSTFSVVIPVEVADPDAKMTPAMARLRNVETH